jgi:hypothetical protein
VAGAVGIPRPYSTVGRIGHFQISHRLGFEKTKTPGTYTLKFLRHFSYSFFLI